jgi:hypothetical protein
MLFLNLYDKLATFFIYYSFQKLEMGLEQYLSVL